MGGLWRVGRFYKFKSLPGASHFRQFFFDVIASEPAKGGRAKQSTLVIPEIFNARAHARSTFREELDVLLRKCRESTSLGSPIRTFGDDASRQIAAPAFGGLAMTAEGSPYGLLAMTYRGHCLFWDTPKFTRQLDILLLGELLGYRSLMAAGQRCRIIYRVERAKVVVFLVAVGIRKEGSKKDIYVLAQKLLRFRLL